MQLVIQNQCKGPGNDCVALTTKLEVFSHASHHVTLTTKLEVFSHASHHVLSVCKISFDLSQ